MKRVFALFALLVLMFLVACGGQTEQDENNLTENDSEINGSITIEEAERLRVIATIFPQYDFVRQIADDRIELSMLITPGAESHVFEPTPRDIVAINNADLFIYIGGHIDEWVETALMAIESDIRAVALIDMVDAVIAEHHHHGYDDHDHSHDHSCSSHSHDDDCGDDDCEDYDHHDCDDDDYDHHYDCDDDDCDYDAHYDEHVWTYPQNSIAIVRELTEILSEMDSANADFYRENADAFIIELQDLDAAFAEVVANGVRRTVVFGDRFPFRYLADAYGLTYFVAFDGCSGETQVTPATLAFLINKVQDEEVPVVFHIEFSNRQIANTIAEATGVRVLEFHSLHNLSSEDFNAGLGFLDLMRRNVDKLREALN